MSEFSSQNSNALAKRINERNSVIHNVMQGVECEQKVQQMYGISQQQLLQHIKKFDMSSTGHTTESFYATYYW
ncbi:MAG: hypothetical protein CMP20_02840 [Rickettsiales bacterium]|nr:hypothetical protein [Rickettsiales bacterium]